MVSVSNTNPGLELLPPKRRILVVTHGYPPLQIYGAELQIKRKVDWWHQRGYQVQVLSADAQQPGVFPFDTLERHEDVVDGVPIVRYRFAAPDASRPLVETFDHPLLRARLDLDIASIAPDLIYQVGGYYFGVSPLEIAAASGIPSVLFAVDFWHACQRITLLRPDDRCCKGPRHAADCAACRFTARASNRELPRPAQRLLWEASAVTARVASPLTGGRFLGVTAFQERNHRISTVLSSTSLVVVNSKYLESWFKRLGVSDERILRIRQGIPQRGPDTRPYTPSSPHRNDGLRLLYLGQVTRHKGVDTLVDAVLDIARKGHSVTLRIHGAQMDGPEVLRRIRDQQHGETIRIGGSLDRAGVQEALEWADVLVAPSRWYENSPNVILEAFLAGIPVVTSNHGGTAEMVRHNTDGLLFEPGNVRSLSTALARLIEEPDLLQQLRSGITPPYGLDVEMEAEDKAMRHLLHDHRSSAVRAV